MCTQLTASRFINIRRSSRCSLGPAILLIDSVVLCSIICEKDGQLYLLNRLHAEIHGESKILLLTRGDEARRKGGIAEREIVGEDYIEA